MIPLLTLLALLTLVAIITGLMVVTIRAEVSRAPKHEPPH